MLGHFGRLLLALLPLLHTASSSSAAPASSDGRIILQYQPTSSIQQVRADVSARGMEVIREFPDLNALLVKPTAVAVAAAAAAGASTAAAQAAALSAALTALPSVATAEPEPIMSVPELSQISTGKQDGNSAAAGRSDTAAAAAAADSSACKWNEKLDVDYAINQDTEGTPYGVQMVQADEPDMRAIAEKYKHKVLYCVLDTGLDTTNQDFKGAVLNGSAVTKPATGKPYPWNQDDAGGGHGTHVSGIIAAVRNGKGTVGVAPEGANLFFYRIMPTGTFGGTEQIEAWTECIAELDRRKAATKTPDMKGVISMSFGGSGDSMVIRNFLAQLAEKRQDVIFLAAAGNEANATYDGDTSYPAAYPDVMAVGAVDASGALATFSSRGPYVALAAPGVNYLSTIPLYLTPASEFYLRKMNVITTKPTLAEVQSNPEFFRIPVPFVPDNLDQPGSGQLIDCELASSTCQNAAGKVCLIERGGSTFCQKVINCQNGGGIAALIYNDASRDLCTQLGAVTVMDGGCSTPAGGYVTTIMLSRGQGLALKNALAAGDLNVKIVMPPRQKEYGLSAMSGTSMATPNAAAVAGLVWSAHTTCTRQEIRTALEATAWMPPAAGAQQGTRNNRYGHGIIQALAAHRYLQQNPCKTQPKPSPGLQQLQIAVHMRPDRGTSSSQTTDASSVVGSWVRVIVRVKDSEGSKPAGAAVKFSMTPSNYLKCNMLSRTTREGGVTSIRCQMLKAGRVAVTVTATMPDKPGQSASSTSYLTVKRS